MITRADLNERIREWGLREEVAEKDYALGWVLWGIGSHPRLAESCAFKGGTCLKKCYVETYRFSEELDFTVLSDGPVEASQVGDTYSERSLRAGVRGVGNRFPGAEADSADMSRWPVRRGTHLLPGATECPSIRQHQARPDHREAGGAPYGPSAYSPSVPRHTSRLGDGGVLWLQGDIRQEVTCYGRAFPAQGPLRHHHDIQKELAPPPGRSYAVRLHREVRIKGVGGLRL